MSTFAEGACILSSGVHQEDPGGLPRQTDQVQLHSHMQTCLQLPHAHTQRKQRAFEQLVQQESHGSLHYEHPCHHVKTPPFSLDTKEHSLQELQGNGIWSHSLLNCFLQYSNFSLTDRHQQYNQKTLLNIIKQIIISHKIPKLERTYLLKSSKKEMLSLKCTRRVVLSD